MKVKQKQSHVNEGGVKNSVSYTLKNATLNES